MNQAYTVYSTDWSRRETYSCWLNYLWGSCSRTGTYTRSSKPVFTRALDRLS